MQQLPNRNHVWWGIAYGRTSQRARTRVCTCLLQMLEHHRDHVIFRFPSLLDIHVGLTSVLKVPHHRGQGNTVADQSAGREDLVELPSPTLSF